MMTNIHLNESETKESGNDGVGAAHWPREICSYQLPDLREISDWQINNDFKSEGSFYKNQEEDILSGWSSTWLATIEEKKPTISCRLLIKKYGSPLKKKIIPHSEKACLTSDTLSIQPSRSFHTLSC